MTDSATELLRQTIRMHITERAAGGDVFSKLDARFDNAEDVAASILDSIASELDAEAERQETDRVDEAGVALVAGAALALPVIMKGIAKLVRVFQPALAGAGVEGGAQWDAWIEEKADELHHLYIGACEKIVDAAIKVAEVSSLGRYKGPSPEARKKAANVLFMAILAALAASAGVGIANALAGKAYVVAGTETMLGGIKLAEIQVIASELIVDILGFGVADIAATAGAVAASVGLG